MKTKQTIAIIGTADTVAPGLANGNYRLLLCSDRKDSQDDLAATIIRDNPGADVEAMPCPMNASWEADIIVLSVPVKAQKEVAEKIRQVANQKLIISIGERLNSELINLLPNGVVRAR